MMCFCDGYSFVVIHTLTGGKQFIEGDEGLCEFFQGHYTLPHLFHRLGIEDPGLWRICPKEYRHLLRDERRSELQNRKVELW